MGLAKRLNPISLIEAGGIEKTSAPLAVHHHHGIKKRFGRYRRLFSCDQFSASRAKFFNRLSKFIGTGVKSENLTPPLPSELSLAFPAFKKLDPNARELLGVVAFFPQGVHEKNLDWLFPTISNRDTIFDKFCILSLTYRSNGFITMLAPLRDYLCPKDPKASTLLCTIRDLYITRLSVTVRPSMPGFEDTRWITSEDANVEHLFDVFTSIDPSLDIWKACNHFIRHLYWHKPRKTVLRSKIEQLPNDYRWKPRGIFELSGLYGKSGSRLEEKRLLILALKLWRDRGGPEYWIAHTLRQLAETNWSLLLPKEGIPQAKEGLGIFERLGNTRGQAVCLISLARLFLHDGRLDTAEESAIRSITLVGKHSLCGSHRVLGDIFRSKGERQKAIHHYNVALGIADRSNRHYELFWINYSLAQLFRDEGALEDANTHVKRAKQHTLNDEYTLGRGMEMQAKIWYRQGRLEDAASEASRAIEIYGKLGAASHLQRCNTFLRKIEKSMNKP